MRKDFDYTKGPILKSILLLSLPIIFANVMQTAYQLIDAFWVGRLGSDQVAAISVSFPIIFFMISLGAGFAIAGTVLVAQAKGRKDEKSIEEITGQITSLVIITSLVLGILGYFASGFIINLMGLEQAIVADATSYLKISFLGFTFLFFYFTFQSLMRGVGEVKIPLYIVIGTVLMNAVLDPLLMFGYGIIPAMGVNGTAIATIITQGIAALIGLVILLKGHSGIKLVVSEMKLRKDDVKKIVKLGIPSSIEQSSRSVALVALTFIVAGFGSVVVAAYGVGSRLLSFVIIPALGFSMATSTLVGQNVGAKKIKRSRKIILYSSFLGFTTLTLVGILFFIFAKPLALFFVPTDEVVAEMAATFVRFMALAFGFLAVQQVLTGAFRGAGATTLSMFATLMSLWLLRVPLVFILGNHTSLAQNGIWLAFPIEIVIGSIVTFIVFLRNYWIPKNLKDIDELETEAYDEVLTEEGMQ